MRANAGADFSQNFCNNNFNARASRQRFTAPQHNFLPMVQRYFVS